MSKRRIYIRFYHNLTLKLQAIKTYRCRSVINKTKKPTKIAHGVVINFTVIVCKIFGKVYYLFEPVYQIVCE